MRIANPMYDAAFKYLMDDRTAARLLVRAALERQRAAEERIADLERRLARFDDDGD